MRTKTAWVWFLFFLVLGGVVYLFYAHPIDLPKGLGQAEPKADTKSALSERPRIKPNKPRSVDRSVHPVMQFGNPMPKYPEYALRRHHEGTVLLHIHVAQDGGVNRAEILNSSGSKSLDRSALETVTRSWRFTPGREGGKPVAMWHKLKITFTCESGGRDLCRESY